MTLAEWPRAQLLARPTWLGERRGLLGLVLEFCAAIVTAPSVDQPRTVDTRGLGRADMLSVAPRATPEHRGALEGKPPRDSRGGKQKISCQNYEPLRRTS